MPREQRDRRAVCAVTSASTLRVLQTLSDEGPCQHLIVPTGAECGATGRLETAMCVHEHVRKGYQCAEHRARRDSHACCRVCWDLGHRCGLVFW